MYRGGRGGILREEDKSKGGGGGGGRGGGGGGGGGGGRSGGGGGDNNDNDTDGTDNAGAGNLPPLQMLPPAINVRGIGSCLIHDFLGITGFEQCLVVPRLDDDCKDKEVSSAPQ